MNLSFYTVNSDYCDYLRQFDKCVPYTMQQKSTRPFLGVLIEVNGHTYYAPLSSPKPKHQKMKNQLDFIKINQGYWGAINLNNMIPIMPELATKVNPNELTRNYDNEKYRNLLNNQLSWCNSNKDYIVKKAHNLYNKITGGNANMQLQSRCCNFLLLEDKSLEYSRQMQAPSSDPTAEPLLPNEIPNLDGQSFGGIGGMSGL